MLEDITKGINGLVEVLFRRRHKFWRKDIRDSIAIESWGRSASFIERIDGCTAVDETHCDMEFFSVEFPSVRRVGKRPVRENEQTDLHMQPLRSYHIFAKSF